MSIYGFLRSCFLSIGNQQNSCHKISLTCKTSFPIFTQIKKFRLLYNGMKNKIKALFPPIFFSFLASLLLLTFLGTIPGLHGDEAWYGVCANNILHGHRPIVGMNNYTGSIHQYIIALLFKFFGCKVSVLRFFTAFSFIICSFLYYFIIKRLFDKSLAILSTLILVSLPFFTTNGRIALEQFALNPLLALISIFLLLTSSDKGCQIKFFFLFFSGVCLGLGTWNHVIFITLPITLLIIAIVFYGKTIFLSAINYSLIFGFIIAFLPRIVLHSLPDFTHSPGGILLRICEWPALLFEIAHGDILFQRYSGEVIMPSANIVFFLSALGLMMMIKKYFMRKNVKAEIQTIMFTFILFTTTLVICPGNSDRYMLLILFTIPIYAAFPFSELLKRTNIKKITIFVFCAFICLQLIRTSVNYFASQIHSHGKTSSFLLGSMPETSNHFIDTQKLYQQLISYNAKYVSAEFFIAAPLHFYDLQQERIPFVSDINFDPNFSKEEDGEPTFLVFYSGGLRQAKASQYPQCESVSEDDHFVIIKCAPKNTIQPSS